MQLAKRVVIEKFRAREPLPTPILDGAGNASAFCEIQLLMSRDVSEAQADQIVWIDGSGTMVSARHSIDQVGLCD